MAKAKTRRRTRWATPKTRWAENRIFSGRSTFLIMIPGELFPAPGEIVLNEGRASRSLLVANTGDRPIQVGSHYHFAEANKALSFDRQAAMGHRLDIPAGTAVRFEPGQSREVSLVAYAGSRLIYGFNQRVMGPVR